jgi:hypothetical protein
MYKTYASALDSILRKLIDESQDIGGHHFVLFRNELDYLVNDFNVSGFEIDNMLNELAYEKYIQHFVTNQSSCYSALFKGMDLIREGGFTKERQRKTNNAIFQLVVNVLLCFGGASAGIYYLCELLKTL